MVGIPGELQSRESWYRSIRRRLAAIDPLFLDTLLAVILAVPLLIDLSRFDASGAPPPFRDADLVGFVLVALLVVPLAMRRRHPVGAFVVILSAAVMTALFAYRPVSYGFGLIVATYSVARWCDRRRSLTVLVAAFAFSVGVKIRFMVAGIEISYFDWPLDTAYIVGAWFLGRSIRIRTQQAAELERNREALAQQVVEREHLRIARELHDSLGHSLSVMVLYAGAAERVAEQPERSRPLLEIVARSGRDALAEMDRLVRELREEERSSTASIRDIDGLAEELRGLGLTVRLSVRGEARPLPRDVELSVYRIAQEALTNTLKHSRADTAKLCIDYGDNDVTLVVTDSGRGSEAIDLSTTERHGLVGMRERASALGGELLIGNPADESGFQVEARIPIPSESES